MDEQTVTYRKWFLTKRNLELTTARLTYEVWREKLKPLHLRPPEHDEYVRQIEIYQARMRVQLQGHMKVSYKAKPNWIDRLVVRLYEWAMRDKFEEYKIK